MVKALVFGTKDCAFESHYGRLPPNFFFQFFCVFRTKSRCRAENSESIPFLTSFLILCFERGVGREVVVQQGCKMEATGRTGRLTVRCGILAP